MKKIKSFLPILLVSLFWNCTSFREKKQLSNVNQYFIQNFKYLNENLGIHPIKESSIKFIYLVSLFSGTDVNIQSYTGEPQINRETYNSMLKWYKQNKTLINPHKIETAISILNKKVLSEGDISILDSLKH
jgi:hypothetical protein